MPGQGYGVTFDLEKEMRKAVNKFKKINYNYTQEALNDVGKSMADKLARSTPPTRGTGLFARSWKVKRYPNAVFVYNERGTGGINTGIPVSNLAEYAKTGPDAFIVRTSKEYHNKMYSNFIKIMKQKLSK